VKNHCQPAETSRYTARRPLRHEALPSLTQFHMFTFTSLQQVLPNMQLIVIQSLNLWSQLYSRPALCLQVPTNLKFLRHGTDRRTDGLDATLYCPDTSVLGARRPSKDACMAYSLLVLRANEDRGLQCRPICYFGDDPQFFGNYAIMQYDVWSICQTIHVD